MPLVREAERGALLQVDRGKRDLRAPWTLIYGLLQLTAAGLAWFTGILNLGCGEESSCILITW